MPTDTAPIYRTRFSPSPTGPLHFGSLVAAVGSYLRAREKGGEWLIRIDDIDPPREVPGAARAQIETLAQFGLQSNQPILYQRSREAIHRKLISWLVDNELAYPCACSSKSLPESGIYPGTCRRGLAAGQVPRSIRLKTALEAIGFVDFVQGPQCQNVGRDVGDFIIRRGDGLIAYQLAVVADDHFQGITEVVRGADLLGSVGRQLLVYRALNFEKPDYFHLPLVVDQQGRKLSKSDGADPVSKYPPTQVLRLALRALGQEPPSGAQSLDTQWQWAVTHWSSHKVPKGPVTI